jgi:phospholipid/cholesterol/gamma-HCH transport system substrate-binding protein
MEDKVNLAVVGAFVLILGTALIGAVLWLSSGQPYGSLNDIYHVYMRESVSGLNLNAPVRYRGVEVGRVRRIALAPGNVEQVQLTLAIASGTPVRTSTGPSLMVRLDASLIDAARTLKNAARLSEDLPQLVRRIAHSADVFDSMSNELARAGNSASTKFTGETLPQAHQLMVELRDLTASMRRVSEQLEQNPGALLYGRPATKRGPGE